MKFGLDKCATAEFKRGKLTKTTSIILDEKTTIKEQQQEDSYKYLGIAKMKEKISQCCFFSTWQKVSIRKI